LRGPGNYCKQIIELTTPFIEFSTAIPDTAKIKPHTGSSHANKGACHLMNNLVAQAATMQRVRVTNDRERPRLGFWLFHQNLKSANRPGDGFSLHNQR
jgi:hypothetical protein